MTHIQPACGRLLLFLLCVATLPLHGQWTRMDLPLYQGSRGQFFTEGNDILVRFSHGISRSEDQGVHWQPYSYEKSVGMLRNGSDWYSLQPYDLTASVGHYLRHSADNGHNWTTLTFLNAELTNLALQNGRLYTTAEYNYRSQLIQFDLSTQVVDTIWEFQQQGKYIWDLKSTTNSLFLATDLGLLRFRDDGATMSTLFNARPAKSLAIQGDTVFALVTSAITNTQYQLYYSTDDGDTWTTTPFTLSTSPDRIDMQWIDGVAYLFCEDDNLVLKVPSPYQKKSTFSNVYSTDVLRLADGTFLLAGSYGVLSRKAPEKNWVTSHTGVTNPGNIGTVLTAGDLLQTAGEFSADTGKTWSQTLVRYFTTLSGGTDSTSSNTVGTIVELNGYYYGWGTYIGLLRSTDRRNWTRLKNYLNFNSSALYKTGGKLLNLYGKQLSQSTDGLSWQPTYQLPTNGSSVWGLTLDEPLMHFIYRDVFSYDPYFLTSPDRGAHWYAPVAGFPDLTDLDLEMGVPSGENLVIRTRKALPFANFEYHYYISHDAGYHWKEMGDLPPTTNYYDFIVVKDQSVFVSDGQNLLVTANDGEDWGYVDRDSITGGLTNLDFYGDLMVLSTSQGAWTRPLSSLQIRHYSGTVFLDPNHNHVRDAGEPAIPGIVLKLSSRNLYATTDSLGHYDLFAEAIDDTLRAVMPRPYWVSTPGQVALQPTQEVNDFAVHIPAGIRDVAVVAVEKTRFLYFSKPEVVVYLTNYGSEPIEPFSLTLFEYKSNYPPVFLNSTPAPAVHFGDSLAWDLPGLPVLGQATVEMRFSLPFDPLLAGFTARLPFEALVDHDSFPADNRFKLVARLVGSFDPNEKTVSPEQVLQTDLAATDLQYVIRFQNTGNYPADLVVIKDTLPAGLDPATLQVVGASHPYTWRLYDEGVVEFRFEHINLPDSTADEPNSHGFVAFQIKPDATLAVGDSVPNRAAIYFDYNPPVMTAYAVVQVTQLSQTQTPNPAQQLELEIYPNPATGNALLHLRWPDMASGRVQLEILDARGRLVQQSTATGNQAHWALSNLPAGAYSVQLRAASFTAAKMLIIK